MAPPPEYDKEPKAPDKSANNIPSEDSKALYTLVNEHQTNSDSKSTNSSANAEVENNKHVEALDDGQLRALLDEAITYKCPKDREGKSSLFKELLEEVEQDEQDEQACAAAARLGGARSRRGGARGRRALPHSNSLQDLVAALAAEPAPRRARHHAHPPAPVSARAHHGGSLPSGVDTSFLLSEEPMRGVMSAGASGGAEYVATVRCVNPSPLAERRVSASDAHCPDTDTLRRSKPVFPMYTARATLEIGSGSVCSGRAVTTTTASNQVRTPRGAPARRTPHTDAGKSRADRPRGPRRGHERSFWDDGACVDKWYRGLGAYGEPLDRIGHTVLAADEHFYNQNVDAYSLRHDINLMDPPSSPLKVLAKTYIMNEERLNLVSKSGDTHIPVTVSDAFEAAKYSTMDVDHDYKRYNILDVKDVEEAMARQAYRERVGRDLVAPSLLSCNPSNVRSMSIGTSLPPVNTDKRNQNASLSDARDKPGKDKHNRNACNMPADKNKPNNRSKLIRRNVEQIRSPSPRYNVNTHLTTKNKTEDQDTKVKAKGNSQNDELEPEKDSDLVKTVIAKEKPRNDKAEPEKASDLVKTVITKEILRNDEAEPDKASDLVTTAITKEEPQNVEAEPEKASDLVRTVITKEKPQNVKAEPEKALDLVRTVITKEKPQNVEAEPEKAADLVKTVITKEKPRNEETKSEKASDFFTMTAKENSRNYEEKLEKATDLVEMILIKVKSQNGTEKVTEGKRRNDDNETENDANLVEMVSFQNSSKTETTCEFSQFIENQHRLMRAIESNNGNEETLESNLETPDKKYRSADQEMKREHIERQNENPFLPAVDSALDRFDDTDSETQGTEMVDMKRAAEFKSDSQLANASYFLTLYKRLLTSPCNIDNTVDIKPAVDTKPVLSSLETAAKPPKKKKDKITARLSRKPHNENSNKKKDIIRNALKKLFFDNITQSDSKFAGSTTTKEVDSAIPFSCITTPEVVASCTTTASAQAAVAVDPKPARSMAASTFNGVPLPRAGPAFSAAAAVAHAAAEEFKKSLDENGNSVQGFSSPQSGSSQQKKQRRKKSSKNETVIKSHHIDGYQGNKDLNEVLRFIESNEPERPKRHDDKKKRSAERRKDKAPRASSLDGLSRAAAPPARPARAPLPAPKPERRSWGDERPPFYFRHDEPEPEPEPTDFQTVTKKRKPRRRTDEPERGDRQRPRAPSPRSPRSPHSPPSPRARSDRSNDSNDDLDSVHSLPALPSRPAPPASYADIARTKHNIPDLIESCNYYGEGSPTPAGAPCPTTTPGDADGYPALEPRGGRRARDEPRRPDVVADRRPPVILLESAGRARELDGVTFGFDVNEQLLGGARAVPVPVRVRDGCAPLRYVPPAPPADDHHLHQIVDYVGTAWEDVVRCGGGKVRYFSE